MNCRTIIAFACGLFLISTAAHAQATYRFAITNQSVTGNVSFYQASTCSQMQSCPTSNIIQIPTGYTATTTGGVSRGTNPGANMYLQFYDCSHGYCATTKCEISIAGGTVSADGNTCTAPNAFAYWVQGPNMSSCSIQGAGGAGYLRLTASGNCAYTATFDINP